MVENWVRPSSMTEVRSFVRLSSDYFNFVKKSPSIDSHFTNLTKNEIQFI